MGLSFSTCSKESDQVAATGSGCCLPVPPRRLQERSLAFAVLVQVGGQAALGFLDVGSGLVEGQRQSIHFARDGFSRGAVGGAGLLKRIAQWQHSGAPQEEQHSLIHVHLFDGQAIGERSGSLGARGEQEMSLTSWW